MANENRTFRSALDFRFQIKLAYQRDEKKSILKKTFFFILLASFAPLHSHPAEFDNVNGETPAERDRQKIFWHRMLISSSSAKDKSRALSRRDGLQLLTFILMLCSR